MEKQQTKSVAPKTSFSIVVPFRNEAENLPKLLHSLSLLHYPEDLVEIILVDDFSAEKFQVSGFRFQVRLVENIRKTNSPKKDAINTAISFAKYDWIITTDADCFVPINWLKSIDNYILSENKKMVVAGVCYLPKSGFLHQFQQLDFLSLQGVTLGSFGINKPFMCNGANFAYKKSFFQELNGFDGNSDIASGDDVFLLQKALKIDPKQVGFCATTESVVATKSVTSWVALFFQRVRWASKASAYQDGFSKLVAIVVFLTNLLWIVGFGFWVLGILTYEQFLLYFGVKFLIDYILISKSAHFFKTKIKYVLLCSLLYPFFTSFVAFYSFFGKYEWKGRKF